MAYMWGSADTSLAKFHYEMSELFDKEVNTQKESLKKASGVHASSHKPTKIVHENETKNYAHIKLLLMEGSTL